MVYIASPSRSVAVRRVGLVGATLVVGVAACALTPPRDPVGITRETGGERGAQGRAEASASASASASMWAYAKDVRAWPKANRVRFLSTGHLFGRWDADVHVNAAASAYASVGPGSSLAVGAVVAKVHAPVGEDGPGPILAMEKRAHGWMYVEVDGYGRVVREGRLHPCVDCHVPMASQDELFGVPSIGRGR